MTEASRTVEIAGVAFEARGSGGVLTGTAGPQPSKDCSGLLLSLDNLTRDGLPLHWWSHHPDDAEAPMFVLEEPIIYVGTTRHGLHSVLLGVKTTEDGPTGVGLLRWTHEGNGASITYHWPTLHDRPHFSWQVQEGNAAECVLTWFPLPPETAHVDCTFDRKTIAETVRPVSRVVVVPMPADVEHRFVDALAYDPTGAPILRARPR
ncbi:MAG: hypothetical protein OEW30_14190 [Acidimicrobiia bacterium]|nr:hypothetical protein [Acidimicrobiia bacterium]MDH5295149.1 hypothetical protein [Acidimicrobiia bacterium]